MATTRKTQASKFMLLFKIRMIAKTQQIYRIVVQDLNKSLYASHLGQIISTVLGTNISQENVLTTIMAKCQFGAYSFK